MTDKLPRPEPPDVARLLADFKDALAKVIKPGDAQAHFDLAIAYEELGLHAEALEELAVVEQAGGLRPELLAQLNMARAHQYCARAQARETAGDLAGALMDYQRVRAIFPDHVEANAGYARLAPLVLLA